MNVDPRRRLIVPKRNWMQRNPRLFVTFVTTTALLVFFSKPLYDGFFGEPVPRNPGPVREIHSIRIGPR